MTWPLGSGSFDGVIGTDLFTRWQRFFMSAHVQYALRSTGDFDYRYANDLIGAGGPGFYLVLNPKWTLGLQASFSGEQKGRDTFQGETADDTGIGSVFAGPQVNVTWLDKLNAHVGIDLPVNIQNTGLQAVADYRLHAALIWHF